MSKFNETFDQIQADESLMDGIYDRINTEKQGGGIEPRRSGNYSIKKRRKPRFGLIAVAAILIFVMIFPLTRIILNTVHNPAYDFSAVKQVRSEQQLTGLLNQTGFYPRASIFSGCSSMSTSIEDMSASPDAGLQAPSADMSSNGKNSSTNSQTAGMEEGDIVKNDGQYIYRLATGGFTAVRTDQGMLEKVCSLSFENFVPIEMYIREEKLILIGGGRQQNFTTDSYRDYVNYHNTVAIRVYDFSEMQNPKLERYFEVEGNYFTSRIQEAAGVLYFVVNYYNGQFYQYGHGEKRPYLRYDEAAESEPLLVEDIYYFKNNPSKSYMILGAMDLNDSKSDVVIKSYLSSSGIIYVSRENLYIATNQWFYSAWSGSRNELRTYIAKFSLSDFGFVGSGVVKGSPKDRYCLSEYDGYLRVATSYGGFWNAPETACGVYVFDESMQETGKILGIAEGEGIDSASFSGTKGYISTSVRNIFYDPLFIIDFSDPKNLTISEGLKEQGINQYMKAIEGTQYVLGIGTDSTETDRGGFSKTGLKIQLYDMSGEEAVSAAKFTIEGSFSDAEILRNPKALLYWYDEDTQTGLVGFSAERAGTAEILRPGTLNPYNAYTIFAQGVYLYRFDAQSGTLEEAKLLSNFDTDSYIYQDNYHDYNNSWEKQLSRYQRYINRAVVNNGYLYTVADSVIAGYDLTSFLQLDILSDVR